MSHPILDALEAKRDRDIEEHQALLREIDVSIARTENLPTEDRIQAIIGMLEADHYRGFSITTESNRGMRVIWLRSIQTPGGTKLALHESTGFVTGSGIYRDDFRADDFTIKIWEALGRLAGTPGSLPDRIQIKPLPARHIL